MTTSHPCSERTVVSIEGMPGSGKTTLATALAQRGYAVVGEYTTTRGATVSTDTHPPVSDDNAHQSNWLHKHRKVPHSGAQEVVFLDRDWLSSLSYAYSIADPNLLAARTRWALHHLDAGSLTVADQYLVLHVATAESLRRRVRRLDPRHPWSVRPALERLSVFYRDPAQVLDRDLADRLRIARWTHIDNPTPRVALQTIDELGLVA